MSASRAEFSPPRSPSTCWDVEFISAVKCGSGAGAGVSSSGEQGEGGRQVSEVELAKQTSQSSVNRPEENALMGGDNRSVLPSLYVASQRRAWSCRCLHPGMPCGGQRGR